LAQWGREVRQAPSLQQHLQALRVQLLQSVLADPEGHSRPQRPEDLEGQTVPCHLSLPSTPADRWVPSHRRSPSLPWGRWALARPSHPQHRTGPVGLVIRPRLWGRSRLAGPGRWS
jgi:hypothetical protein